MWEFWCAYMTSCLASFLLEIYNNIIYFFVAVSSLSKMSIPVAVSMLLIMFILVGTSSYVKLINKNFVIYLRL
jgi:hypothetical protein